MEGQRPNPALNGANTISGANNCGQNTNGNGLDRGESSSTRNNPQQQDTNQMADTSYRSEGRATENNSRTGLLPMLPHNLYKSRNSSSHSENNNNNDNVSGSSVSIPSSGSSSTSHVGPLNPRSEFITSGVGPRIPRQGSAPRLVGSQTPVFYMRPISGHNEHSSTSRPRRPESTRGRILRIIDGDRANSWNESSSLPQDEVNYNYNNHDDNNDNDDVVVFVPRRRNTPQEQINRSRDSEVLEASRNRSSGPRIGESTLAPLLPHQMFALSRAESSSSYEGGSTSHAQRQSDQRSAALDLPGGNNIGGDDLESRRRLMESLGRRQSMISMHRAQMRDRRRAMGIDVDDMTYEDLLALQERMGNVGSGLNEDKIKGSMKRRRCGDSEASTNSEMCCICQEDYVDGDDIGKLDCGHEFHTSCIEQWLILKNICPICKRTGVKT